MRTRPFTLSVALTFVSLAASIPAQTLYPDLMYYKFNEPAASTTTANTANPGTGVLQGTLSGMTLGGAGQFAGGLVSAGTSGTYVDSGWNTALGTGDWTISCWLDISTVAAVNPFGYFFGDSTAGAFRAFCNGAAGTGNVILRGPLTDVVIAGGANQAMPNVVTWVYDGSVPEVRGYLNGALVNTVGQSPLNINGSAPFRVGGYTSTVVPAGGVMDEFRMWGRALTPGEISMMWNVELQNVNELVMTQDASNNLTVQLNMVSPSGAEGFTLSSFSTASTTGTGPMFGIFPDGNTWSVFGEPYSPGDPFHFNATDPPNVWPNADLWVPGTLLAPLSGQTVDFCVILFNPSMLFDSSSNVVRHAFQ